MQYILNEDEYQEFCRLRADAARRRFEAELAAEESRMVQPQGALRGSFFIQHLFKGSRYRGCEICEMPDSDPIHF